MSTPVAFLSPLERANAARELAQPGSPVVDSWWRTLIAGRAAFDAHRQRVLDDWRTHGSFCALLEIVDARIEPNLGRIRMDDVIDLLGTQNIDRNYPNSRRDNFLVWSSHRLIPQGSYLIVRFDRAGVAQSVDWASE